MKPCIAAVCLLVSCASPQEELIRTSSDSDARTDSATKYEGDWRALMKSTESVQNIAGYRFDCAPFTEAFFLRVRKNIVAGFMEADENYSFTTTIDQRGRFKALIPTDSVYTYKDAVVERQSNIVLVLEGQLQSEQRTGRFVIGDAAIDGQGCSTRVQFVVI